MPVRSIDRKHQKTPFGSIVRIDCSDRTFCSLVALTETLYNRVTFIFDRASELDIILRNNMVSAHSTPCGYPRHLQLHVHSPLSNWAVDCLTIKEQAQQFEYFRLLPKDHKAHITVLLVRMNLRTCKIFLREIASLLYDLKQQNKTFQMLRIDEMYPIRTFDRLLAQPMDKYLELLDNAGEFADLSTVIDLGIFDHEQVWPLRARKSFGYLKTDSEGQ
ncbi:hypothetical protein BU23DRAFT_16020 [Bimuria novae-zelandiae CBS 107.79]|uniref:Uncharacterized protein n=1 Tax=Bimuria novae-zelandiae CBS 107.79 TaxID=1447943 RepID=A0A6A5VIA9_9PLEO|nr:hypothetical protein BU23DRAFT_16020 [Bimuria novae-zelandiae CBS 107.79]